jgi:hypothetical protein
MSYRCIGRSSELEYIDLNWTVVEGKEAANPAAPFSEVKGKLWPGVGIIISMVIGIHARTRAANSDILGHMPRRLT